MGGDWLRELPCADPCSDSQMTGVEYGVRSLSSRYSAVVESWSMLGRTPSGTRRRVVGITLSVRL